MTPSATPSPPQDETSPDSRDGGPLPLWRIGTLGLAFLTLATFLLAPRISQPHPTSQALESSFFSQPSFDPGETAVFHVADSGLDTLFSCTATWVDADPGGETWGLRTHTGTSSPASPRRRRSRATAPAAPSCRLPPRLSRPTRLGRPGVGRHHQWSGERDSRVLTYDELLRRYNAEDIPDVTSTSTVAIPFYFHAQNSYPASAAAGAGDERRRPGGRVGVACGGGEHHRQRRGGQVRRVQGLGRAEGGRSPRRRGTAWCEWTARAT